jgi:phage-related tail fiber protein
MSVLKIERTLTVPETPTASTMYIARNTDSNYVDLTFVGDSAAEIRRVFSKTDYDTLQALGSPKLTTARSISATGDASWSVNFDGSANATAVITLANSGVTAGTYGKVTVDAKGLVTAGLPQVIADISDIGSAVVASSAILTTARSIAATGDATWSVTFNGSANVTSAITLADSGVTAGTYPKVTVDAKGRVTTGASLIASDVPSLDWTKITTGTPTTLSGYGISDAYTKAESDIKFQGLSPKPSVLCATTTNITLSGTAMVIDGITPLTTMDVLVKDQTIPSQNGIYRPAAGVWTRSTNAGTWDELVAAYIVVQQGTLNHDTSWLCTIDTSDGVLGTNAVNFAVFTTNVGYAPTVHTHTISDVTNLASASVASAGVLTTARSISATGDASWSVNFDGSANATAAITFADSGVTAGTYGKVTVDAKGRVTAGLPQVIADISDIGSAVVASSAILTTARSISATGDASWSVNFDGSANATAVITLANSGVTAGTYGKVTVDAKGRVTTGDSLIASDVPVLTNAHVNAQSSNTASAVVSRDASGNFSAGVITATSFNGPSTGVTLTSAAW